MTRRAILLSPIFLVAILFFGFGPAWVARAQSGPHGGYTANTDACAACHRSHTSPGARLRISSGQGNAFCYNCHNGTDAPAVSTHGNSDFSGGVEDSFQLECTQCHDPHGAGNLYLIRKLAVVNPAPVITTGPVVFTATVGINSYDDGISNPAGRICVTCHENNNNSGYPMTNHTGGTGHMGGLDFTGLDCPACHRHDTDDDRSTVDGFMPAGGCTTCHAEAQDNGDGFPAGGRRVVVDEFAENSHHVQGQVTDTDCLLCHEITTHANGYLQLKNVDTQAIFDEPSPGAFRPESITAADSQALAPFCLSCHDSDGAAGDTRPFSTGDRDVPAVNSTAWSVAAHDTGGVTTAGYGCLGDGATSGCHASAHGSANEKILAASSGTQSIDQFCYNCHTEGQVMNDALANNRPGGYTSADDIEEAFGKSEVHNLGTAFTIGSDTFAIQCTTCHNPHLATGKYWEAESGLTPITRPDFSDSANNPRAMGTTLWGDEPGEKMDDFAAQGSGTGGWYDKIARGYQLGDTGLPVDRPAVYQPPRAGNGYDAEFSGAALPDYTTLCLDCHTHRMSAANPPVNWGQGIACTDNSVDPPDQRIECGAQHGLGSAGMPGYVSDEGTAGFWGNSGNPDPIFNMPYVTRGRHNGHFMRWPYDSADRSAGINFVLSCTDCHEAHGSDRGSMIRERFNVNANGDCGAGGDSNPNGENCADGSNWNSFCNACHYYYGGQHAGMSCGNASCHEANSVHRIIHTVDSGANTQLMVTAGGWEGSYPRPTFTPEIASVEGHIGGYQLVVTFTEDVFTDIGLLNGLNRDDFLLTDVDGNNPRLIVSVLHIAGTDTATLMMSASLQAADLGRDILAARGKSVWNWDETGYTNQTGAWIGPAPVPAGPWPVAITGLPPVSINQVEGVSGSDQLFVEFSEAVYSNLGGVGNLQPSDFALADADNGRSITNVIHTAGESTATLVLSLALDDTDDIGTDTVAAAGDAIYDGYGLSVITDPVTITVTATAPSLNLARGVAGHDRIVVRFSEAVFTNPDGTGALQPTDFACTDPAGKSIIAVEHTPGRFSAALILDGNVDAADIGTATVAAVGGSIYDITGFPASATPLTLAEGLISSLAQVEGVAGSNRLKVTFQTQVYAGVSETGALQAGDFVLANAGGKSINSVQHAAGSPVAIITMTGPLDSGEIGAATLAAAGNSIFGPSPGNFPLGTDPVTISGQPAPLMTGVEGAVNYDQLTVFFSEGVYGDANQSTALAPADFVLTDVGGNNSRSISAVQHNAGDSVAILTMSQALAADDAGADTLAAGANGIFNPIGQAVGATPVTLSAGACPTWGTRFDFGEGAGSATVTDDSTLLIGDIGNPTLSMQGDGLYRGDATEAESTYIDLNRTGYDKCLMSPRSFTLETMFYAGDIDLDYTDNNGNGFDDDYDVANDPLGQDGDGRNYTGMRLAERQGTFQLTAFRAGFAGDFVESRAGKARIILKYRTDDTARHSCPHPQWPDDDYTGADAPMHQISTDIDQWPILDNHWYKIKVVFNSDKTNIPGSNGTPIDIFLDDLGADGLNTPNPTPGTPTQNPDYEQWPDYVNASRAINQSSSCKWGALPGDFVRTIDKFTAIGDNLSHTDVPGDTWNLMLKGRLDWFSWKPGADYWGNSQPLSVALAPAPGPATIYLPLLVKNGGPRLGPSTSEQQLPVTIYLPLVVKEAGRETEFLR